MPRRGDRRHPWSPLARGRLARPWEQKAATYRAGADEFGKTLYAKTEDADRTVVDQVGKPPPPAGSRAGRFGVDALPRRSSAADRRATKMVHLDDAIAALGVKLSPEEIASLEAPYVPHPVLGFA